jgi:hypothetical protein
MLLYFTVLRFANVPARWPGPSFLDIIKAAITKAPRDTVRGAWVLRRILEKHSIDRTHCHVLVASIFGMGTVGDSE